MAQDRDGLSRREVVATAAGMALGLGTASAGAAESGPSKIMVIRHAEKPTSDGKPPFGLGLEGEHDITALLVQGWQRAGALARFFVPREGTAPVPGIAQPTFLVAAAPTRGHPSRRAGLTLAPLAELTGLVPDASFGPDQEAEAAAAILKRSGVGLVAWEHKRIRDLVAALTGGTVQGPHWKSDRFDMVLVLDRDGTTWRLTQVPQLLLAGDSAKPLRFDESGDDSLTPERNAP
jgi:hypothetical protein